MINELQPAEIASVLQRHHVGRLACIVAGEPYLVPVTYAYRDGVIYGHTLPGQKLEAMRAEPRVAFEVDERWEADTWRSVVVRGVFAELTTEDDRATALAALHGVYPDVSRLAGSGALFRFRPSPAPRAENPDPRVRNNPTSSPVWWRGIPESSPVSGRIDPSLGWMRAGVQPFTRRSTLGRDAETEAAWR